jgi:hypothetical protein
MAEVLYTSGAIHSRIKKLFSKTEPKDRRVVLVAYVGADALKFLPNPKGIRVICSPVLGTDPGAVQTLKARGAIVEASDRLHMKVYWSERNGCVIGQSFTKRTGDEWLK